MGHREPPSTSRANGPGVQQPDASRDRAATARPEVGSIDLGVLVVGELRRGIELVRRKDAKQAAALERWLTRVTAKQPGSVIDTLMAATAFIHGLVLVTRNVKDVAWAGGDEGYARCCARVAGFVRLLTPLGALR